MAGARFWDSSDGWGFLAGLVCGGWFSISKISTSCPKAGLWGIARPRYSKEDVAIAKVFFIAAQKLWWERITSKVWKIFVSAFKMSKDRHKNNNS